MTNLDRALKNLANKGGFDFESDSNSISEEWDEAKKEEARRLMRMEEIWQQANDARVARCERKMAEVGRDRFMDLIHSGEWSDSEDMTEIEKEYQRLRIDLFHVNWFREHGKPYREEDDVQAKF